MGILVSLSRRQEAEHFRRVLPPDTRYAYLPVYSARDTALILAGGGDLVLAGMAARDPDLARDRAERALLWAFLLAGKPVLGICRGHQLIQVALGGRLIGHLPNADCHQQPQGDLWHPIRVEPTSFLTSVYGRLAWVNSNHHQGVAALGEGMICAARTADGLCEAAWHSALGLRSVQWHPERMPPDGFWPAILPWLQQIS